MIFKNNKERKLQEARINTEIDHCMDLLEALRKLHGTKDIDGNIIDTTETYSKIVRNMDSLYKLKNNENKLNINTVATISVTAAIGISGLLLEKFGNGIFPWKISSFMPKR